MPSSSSSPSPSSKNTIRKTSPQLLSHPPSAKLVSALPPPSHPLPQLPSPSPPPSLELSPAQPVQKRPSPSSLQPPLSSASPLSRAQRPSLSTHRSHSTTFFTSISHSANDHELWAGTHSTTLLSASTSFSRSQSSTVAASTSTSFSNTFSHSASSSIAYHLPIQDNSSPDPRSASPISHQAPSAHTAFRSAQASELAPPHDHGPSTPTAQRFEHISAGSAQPSQPTLQPATPPAVQEQTLSTRAHSTSTPTSLPRLHTNSSPNWHRTPEQPPPHSRLPSTRFDSPQGSSAHEHAQQSLGPQSAPAASAKGWSTVKAKLIGAGAGTRSPHSRRRAESVGQPSTFLDRLAQLRADAPPPKQVTTGSELTAELTSGLLPIIMLKMAMDRDEHGQHRIPILMNYLKLQITDSIHPFHATHAVFRIELQYGDNLLKWVIYRELRDFVNLHAAYKASNIVSRNTSDVSLPAFPKTSLPYYNLLKREGKAEGKADFARLQRAGLEEYLRKLTTATMFVPEANRLCKFLEISALSLALATRGGFQGKQGYLRITSSGAFSRRRRRAGLPERRSRKPKWFVVRESYLVAVDEPDQTEVYDLFLVDDEFQLKRPTRLLKQGIHLLDWHDASSAPLPNARAADEQPNLQTTSSHTFYIQNSERSVKLTAKNERQMDQFIASIERMAARSIWHGKNRFDSFAPIRMNVSAQWLVDGRDYFWNLSKAVLLAKERIYIHDWWLSPELYLRRPPAQNQKWRLDKLLERKANEGVQIFVIVYKEVSNGFTPVESGYTKSRLLSLSPNIHIQRSPSHGTGNLLWSHHEKLCVIDETIAFMGGLDLCFGRWDTPGHVLIDDASGGLDFIESVDPRSMQAEESQIWPGKDYSNQRVSDFFNLSKPEEDMYDRDRVPRQPWHDIGLQLVGQPARDLCRHFVQRWNYLLRTKNHTRLMPFLIPPSDFTMAELSERRIIGTCEVQICRSCGPWSIGTPNKIEHSIQTAYVKAIQMSDHFVYIENQFFITSCIVEGTVITNQIGDALVNRIIKAHEEGAPWKAIIIIPTMPGYPSPLNEDAAGSVRLIVECQNRSICRGDTSIFSRLRAEGIDPNDYITFFSLRGWGKLKNGQLTTEGVYIHAKAMIVDDRLAIIGSANINERSQRGDRDSELACVVRDTDMIDGMMAGKPYKVGRFAHTMRVRLMREHLGIDVDALDAEEANMDLIDQQVKTQEQKLQEKYQAEIDGAQHPDRTASASSARSQAWDPDQDHRENSELREGVTHVITARTRLSQGFKSFGNGIKDILTNHSQQPGMEDVVQESMKQKVMKQTKENPEVAKGKDQSKSGEEQPASHLIPTLEEVATKHADKMSAVGHSTEFDGPATATVTGGGREEPNTHPKYLDERAPVGLGEGGSGSNADGAGANRLRARTSSSNVDDGGGSGAESSTTGATGLRYSDQNGTAGQQTPQKAVGPAHHEFLNAPPSVQSLSRRTRGTVHQKRSRFVVTTPAAEIDPNGFEDPIDERFFSSVWTAAASRNTQIFRSVFRCVPDDKVTTWQGYKEYQAWENRHGKPVREEPGRPMSEAGGNGEGEEGGATHGSNGSLGEVPNAKGEQGAGGPAGGSKPTERQRGLSAASGMTVSGGKAGGAGGEGPSGKSAVADGYAGGDGGKTSGTGRKKSMSKVDRKAAGGPDDRGFTIVEREQMEEMLMEVQGNLVLFPTRFMESEDLNNNFLFQKDRIPPLAIYN